MALATTKRDGTERVALSAVVDGRTDTLWGLSNIFFAPDSVGRTLPGAATAKEVELAAVVEREDVRTVLALRWRGDDTSWTYAVDTDGDGEFADERPLQFRQATTVGGVLNVADFRTNVSDTGRRRLGATRAVAFQLLYAGPYAYARPVETYVGEWSLFGKPVAVRVRYTSRNAVAGRSPSDFEVAIDLDGDGAFRHRRDPTPASVSLPVENVSNGPFVAANTAWQVVGVSATGLELRAVDDSVHAIAEGFQLPAVALAPLEGNDAAIEPFTSASDSLTVIEMWSVSCPFSEQARPALNALQRRFASASIRWYSIPRERDRATLDSSLAGQPRSLQVTLVTPAMWDLLNPRTITPTYYLVDGSGRVLLREEGAARVPLLAAAIERAIGESGPSPQLNVRRPGRVPLGGR